MFNKWRFWLLLTEYKSDVAKTEVTVVIQISIQWPNVYDKAKAVDTVQLTLH